MIEIKPGPELNRAVAEAIGDPYPRAHDWEHTGLSSYEDSVYRCKNCGTIDLADQVSGFDEKDPCVRPYSTDLNAAFGAAEKVGLFKQYGYCEAPPALAICAAILKIKETETGNDLVRSEMMDVESNKVGWVAAQGCKIRDQVDDLPTYCMEKIDAQGSAGRMEGDWKNPKWEDAGRVHDWRNYISEEVQDMWNTFTDNQKKALAKSAEEDASKEEWD